MIDVTGTAADAVAAINAAAAPADLFTGAVTDPDTARRGRRAYRMLIALIHPDIAADHGIDADDALTATTKLNDLYNQWQHGATTSPASPKPNAAPHVIGLNGTYLLRDRIRQDSHLNTYATDQDNLYVVISRAAGDATTALTTAAQGLASMGIPGFGPEIADTGIIDGRTWIAYRLPEGLHTLAEVATAYPNGLDGRDWAWMARRIGMILDAAGTRHGNLTLDTILIHPEQHGVVITGWGGGDMPDGDAVAGIFARMLRITEHSQIRFASEATTLSWDRWAAEYDLLLRRLYGERRFRPFSLPGTR